jgi:hydrogenase maturation protein HypF
VLGIALDGLGYGDDGAIWGGEFLLTRYHGYRRLGTFKPIRMLGGAQAIREPWRSLYAHLVTALGWKGLLARYGDLELVSWLAGKPRQPLDRMLETGLNSPIASSCGRLFDAVGAALGFCRDEARYEAQGAMMLESAVSQDAIANGDDWGDAYPFSIAYDQGSIPTIEPGQMWQALLDDLLRGTPASLMAMKFHIGLAHVVARMASERAEDCAAHGEAIRQVALTGGCFQNVILLERVTAELMQRGFTVLTHARVPTNDGGVALGQAAIASAVHLERLG